MKGKIGGLKSFLNLEAIFLNWKQLEIVFGATTESELMVFAGLPNL